MNHTAFTSLSLLHVAKVAGLIKIAAEPLSVWLDARFGSVVQDKSIFASLSQQYEDEFHRDMEALNV